MIVAKREGKLFSAVQMKVDSNQQQEIQS